MTQLSPGAKTVSKPTLNANMTIPPHKGKPMCLLSQGSQENIN